MPLAEDEHPVGDLGPGGEHEPFRISVRSCGLRGGIVTTSIPAPESTARQGTRPAAAGPPAGGPVAAVYALGRIDDSGPSSTGRSPARWAGAAGTG